MSDSLLQLCNKLKEIRSKRNFYLEKAYKEDDLFKKKCFYEICYKIEELISDLNQDIHKILTRVDNN